MIEGKNLTIRQFMWGDITPEYVSWLNDPEVVRFSNQRFVSHTLDGSRQYASSFMGTANRFFAIDERASGRMVGTLTAYRNLNHGTADIGIMVGDKSCWGNGYGLEAFSAVMDLLLAIPEVRKITAGTVALNVGMVKIMERSGMHLEATRVAQEVVEGEPVDIVYYARFS